MKLKTKILIITSIVIIISISAIAVYNTVSSNNAFEEIIEFYSAKFLFMVDFGIFLRPRKCHILH
jgi:hypothetical protein